jgi:hypothetical protein
MKKTLAFALLLFVFSAAGASAAPVTKQNGRNAVFSSFTPICSMPPFLNYGYCNGDAKAFADVAGRIEAVQPKIGRWNLDLTFTHLSPGVSYTLWGNRTGATPNPGSASGFFVADTAIADTAGTAKFTYETTSPTNLGFDLNTTGDNVTIVTSWWSSQWLQILDRNGNLFVP